MFNNQFSMKKLFLALACILFFALQNFAQSFQVRIDSSYTADKILFVADHPMIQYTGRINFTNTKLPRMWSPGVYFSMRFKGSSITAVIKDQELWGKNHNYLEIIVDDEIKRIQTINKNNYISIWRRVL
jgi:hypothetical protein